jgi:hypothetical protein
MENAQPAVSGLHEGHAELGDPRFRFLELQGQVAQYLPVLVDRDGGVEQPGPVHFDDPFRVVDVVRIGVTVSAIGAPGDLESFFGPEVVDAPADDRASLQRGDVGSDEPHHLVGLRHPIDALGRQVLHQPGLTPLPPMVDERDLVDGLPEPSQPLPLLVASGRFGPLVGIGQPIGVERDSPVPDGDDQTGRRGVEGHAHRLSIVSLQTVNDHVAKRHLDRSAQRVDPGRVEAQVAGKRSCKGEERTDPIESRRDLDAGRRALTATDPFVHRNRSPFSWNDDRMPQPALV